MDIIPQTLQDWVIPFKVNSSSIRKHGYRIRVNLMEAINRKLLCSVFNPVSYEVI